MIRLFVLIIICFSCIVSPGAGIGFGSRVEAQDLIVNRTRVGEPDIALLSTALAHYTMGAIYDNFGDIKEAVAEYETALIEKKDIADIYIKLGADLMLLSRLEEAKEALTKAAELDPENTRPHLLLAVVHTAKGEFNKAATQHKETLKYDPENIKALTFLSDLFVAQRKLDKAAEIYEKILRIRDDDAFLYFNLGVIYSKLDLLDKAEEKLKKAIEMDEGYLEAQIILGFIYEIDTKFNKAEKQYKKVIEIDPRNKEARVRLGQLYHKRGDMEKALVMYDKAIELDPSSVEAYLRSFDIHRTSGRYEKAEEILRKAEMNVSDNAGIVQASLGYLWDSQKQYKKAIEAYTKASREDPTNVRYKFYLASILDNAGAREKAIKVLEEIVQSNEEILPEVYNYLGYVYAEQGENLDRALFLVKGAAEKDPKNGAYLDSLGWVYYKKGMLPEALENITEAKTYLPDDPIIREHLGDVYYKIGKSRRAIQEWKKALKAAPDNETVKKKIHDAKGKKTKKKKRYEKNKRH